MAIEEERRVFHENCVRVVWKIRQANDVESRVRERLFVSGMLSGGLRRVDRRSIEVGQLAFGKARADRAGVRARYQR